jgi:hypothetical protein
VRADPRRPADVEAAAVHVIGDHFRNDRVQQREQVAAAAGQVGQRVRGQRAAERWNADVLLDGLGSRERD